MSRVTVSHGIGDLAADLRTIAREAPAVLSGVVRDNIRAGNELAKSYARTANGPESASRKYPGSFTAAMGKGFRGATSSVYSGEYGPIARGQGELAHILEQGLGHNAPQNNLAKSSDIIGPAFAHDAGRKAASLFWPES